jgi:hypothetical protein
MSWTQSTRPIAMQITCRDNKNGKNNESQTTKGTRQMHSAVLPRLPKRCCCLLPQTTKKKPDCETALQLFRSHANPLLDLGSLTSLIH